MSARAFFSLALCANLAACGGSTPEPQTSGTETDSSGDSDRESRKSGPSMEGETGALNDKAVREIFSKTASKARGCFVKGAKRVAFLAGNVHFRVVVDQEGAIKVAYMKDSTLGDRDTEACILAALKAETWPKPEGGKEGYAESELIFDPSDEERPPVDLAPEQLGDGIEAAKSAVSKCKSDSGTGPVKVTFYVETDGKPKSVGVSFADDKGEPAAGCIVSAVKGAKFASPGSYAGKASITFE